VYRYRRTIVSFVGVLTIAARSDHPTSPEVAPCTAETSSVTAAVEVGQGIMFDWEPACGVAMLLVEEDASDMWGISTDEATWTSPDQGNLITPPVTYGAGPSGATEFQEPLPLVAGGTYELILRRILPEGSQAPCEQRFENLCLLAVHAFTR
jgi:hypothetical protein